MNKKSIISLAVSLFLMASSASTVFAANYFNTDDIKTGVIHITYDGGGKTKVMIQKGDKKYYYDINSSGKTESFPLQLGNGNYKVSILVNTSGNSYRLVQTKSVDVNLTDPNSVFLSSIQNIDWNVDSKAVAKAVELTKNETDLEKKAQILWDYMVKNNSYDYAKLSKLSPGYVPVIDSTLAEKKGICYDFSALYAAMLRSQGTPAKLIKGYAPKNASGYHAWNEVYDAKKGWLVIDTTYDLQVISRKPSTPMVKNAQDFSKVYEY